MGWRDETMSYVSSSALPVTRDIVENSKLNMVRMHVPLALLVAAL